MIGGRERTARRPSPLGRGLLLVRAIWMGAVVDDAAIRFNLRLLMTLTALFSVPEMVQGVTMAAHGPLDSRLFGAYVLLLGLLEFTGAGLLALRRGSGCWLIGAAAVGFYPEAVLGLARFERTLLAAAIFAACVPAEAWVLWFVSHRRVRAYLRRHWGRRHAA